MNTNEVLNKLKAEIEGRKIEWKALFDGGENTAAKECFYEDENILVIIDSLQQEQPEVELEKEYKTWWNSISGKINIEHMMEWYMHETARHFYELGLKARKEE